MQCFDTKPAQCSTKYSKTLICNNIIISTSIHASHPFHTSTCPLYASYTHAPIKLFGKNAKTVPTAASTEQTAIKK